MISDKDIATKVKNFVLNYVEVHGVPSLGRNANRVTQSIIFLLTEMSYKSIDRVFLAGLEKLDDISLHSLKFDAFRKLWH
jgi:hypothetical protein